MWRPLPIVRLAQRLPIARATLQTSAARRRSIVPRSWVDQPGCMQRCMRYSSTCKISAATGPVQLRDYQESSIQAVLDHLSRGEKRLGISLATGSGKTVIFSHLLDRVPAPSKNATHTLILAHRRELIEQAARHCQQLYPDKTVEIEMANSKASGLADITLASVPTLARSAERLQKFDPARFKLVIVDEAHHIVAGSYMTILEHFRLANPNNLGPTALVGVSATLSRHDGLKLGTAIDHIVYHKDYVEMIEDEYLAKAIFTTVKTGVNLDKVKVAGGDFQSKALSKAVNNPETNLITVRAWLEKGGSRKSTLVFCVDLTHVADLTAVFRQHGVEAQYITGSTNAQERAERLQAFKNGEYPVLLNCGIFTEGTDIPNIDCILVARPTQSRNLLIQMVGRGLRKYEGKANCHVIDMVASLEGGIITTPTLFGLNSQELVNEADFKTMKSLKERKEQEKQREEQAMQAASQPPPELKGDVIFTDYDSVNDLIEDTMGERQIRKISPFAWVQIDDIRYILTNLDGANVSIKKEGSDEYVLWYTARLPDGTTSKAPYARPRQIGKSATFEAAVHGADTFASETFSYDMISKSAFWRKKPASQSQMDYLNKFRQEDEQLQFGMITKGRAGDLITKIKHGARGRFRRMTGEKKKAQKKVQRWQDRQSREQVRVGPVAR
ncbi:Putative mitochondrial ATP-dependent helicase irc3 [Fulvia fulva]|uniref:Mitochondrial ATP-dependent helicase irc3 n=1 Tax=Passalora fulva TaxID=5499 RepID=A0A9Q8LC35_PASFU|nr:Putative mitochondrial ATP-dependent helicase irc3 [Fulvia fulva]KAK4632701.1 putative mitochondrial ATP-dependent helicase irc3 [Fulvia fulva]UJO14636.1 Putative mitochondrial ATP-dependent helicase irc3 [Fulvia fulva]